MPKYEVNAEFWWKGLKAAVGSLVTMTEAEAKYLSHVVTKKPAVAAAPVAAPAPKPSTPPPVAGTPAPAPQAPANGNGTK
jgi:hypothetical protein